MRTPTRIGLVMLAMVAIVGVPIPLAHGGDRLVVRDDLSKRRSSTQDRRGLISFALISDFHQGDEELTLPSRTNWRNWAAVAPHMGNAQVKAINALAAKGSPQLGLPLSMLFSLGDSADNAQANETRLARDILDGGKLVDPNSGAPGYDDRHERDKIAGGRLRSPVRGQRVVDLANESFYAEGLHYPNGSPIPWYSVHGNHNTKVMGGIPHEDPTWRNVANDWATGDRKIVALNARLHAELARIRKEAPHEEVAFWTRTFALAQKDAAAVGDVRITPADPERRLLDREEWIESHMNTTGAPRGHGFAPASQRCPDVYANAFARRACFVVDHGRFRFIALDDNALGGYTTGSIDRPQAAWLERQLIDASRRYFDRDGNEVINPDAKDRYVVVLNHHTSRGLRNTGTKPATIDELEAKQLQELLLRFPNVIVHGVGHSHSNRVWVRRSKVHDGGHWEISTPSIVDHPHEGRVVEVATNGDGTLSIFTSPFRALGKTDPADVKWDADPTDETKLGAQRRINEDWLAAAGFKAASLEIAGYRYGKPSDRSVALAMADPHSAVTARIASSEVRVLPATFALSCAIALAALLLRRRPTTAPRPERKVRVGATRDVRRAA